MPKSKRCAVHNFQGGFCQLCMVKDDRYFDMTGYANSILAEAAQNPYYKKIQSDLELLIRDIKEK